MNGNAIGKVCDKVGKVECGASESISIAEKKRSAAVVYAKDKTTRIAVGKVRVVLNVEGRSFARGAKKGFLSSGSRGRQRRRREQ